jgi:O-antigen/teichoic acid export membrane protein
MFGVITVGLAVLGYLGQLSGSGIQLLEARNTAARIRVDYDRVGGILSFRLISAIALFLLTTGIAVAVVGSPDIRDSVLLHAAILLPLALYLDWFFQGKEDFAALTLSKLLNSAVYALLVFLTISAPFDFRFAPIALVGGVTAASLFLLALFTMRFGTVRLEVNCALWRGFLKSHLPLSTAMLLAQNAVNLGPIILAILYSNADAGMYGAAMKVIVLLLLLDRTLNGVYLPLISRIRATRPHDVQQTVGISLKLMLIATVPLALCCFFGADLIFSLVFGADFAAASLHFKILLGYFVFTIPNSVLNCTLLAMGKEREYTKILVVGSALLGLLVVLLATAFGPIGAPIGVVLGEMILSVMFLRAVRRVVSMDLVQILVRPSIACAAMAVTMVAVNQLGLPATLIAGCVAFCLVLPGIRGVNQEEIRLLRQRLI